jgi:hypothetical protein
MTQNMPKKIRVRIFVEERSGGMVWVPYKTLIGHAIKGRTIIGRLGEQVHCFEELETKTGGSRDGETPSEDQTHGVVR